MAEGARLVKKEVKGKEQGMLAVVTGDGGIASNRHGPPLWLVPSSARWPPQKGPFKSSTLLLVTLHECHLVEVLRPALFSLIGQI